MYLGIGTGGYGFAFFVPTILYQLGWTAQRAQVMSIPLYCTGAVITIIVAFISDLVKHRYGFVILGVLIATIGYGVLLAQKSVSIPGQYTALYLIAIGSDICQSILLVWTNNNLAGHYKRSVGAAVQLSIGNLSGIVGSNIFLANQRPGYKTGYGVSLGLIWTAAVAATVFFISIHLENKRRDRGERDNRFNLPEDEKDNLGDDDPRFRFVY